MKPIPFVRASVILRFIKFLNQIGAPTERLLKQAHLPICLFDNSEAIAPLIQCLAFAELVARTEGIENLGMIVGQQTQASHIGNFGAVVCQALTLHDLLSKIFKLHSTLISGEKIWLTEDRNHFWLNHQYTIPHHIQAYQGHCFSVFVYLNTIGLAAGSNWQPDQLYLQSSKNKSFLDLNSLSNTQIHFNQPHNAICFSKDLLSKPLNHYQGLSLPGNTEEMLKLTAPGDDFTDSLRQLILLLLPESYPHIAIAAEAAGISIRTFQRRLQDKNLNYSQLVEQVRFDQAVNLLKDSNNQLIDIAFDLGYNDAANFTRAFKRWTGISPRKFRDLHLQQ